MLDNLDTLETGARDIVSVAKSRYSAKAYDPTRKIPSETVAKLRDLLRYSPSSTNIQP